MAKSKFPKGITKDIIIVVVGVLIIWFFSIVGWLDNNAISGTTVLSQYAKQYGLAILLSFLGFFFIARRLFIRRI